MIRKLALLVSMLAVSCVAQAAPAESGEERAVESPCPALLTEAECGMHRDILQRLPEGATRREYLARHAALLEERKQSCACTMARNGIGRLRY